MAIRTFLFPLLFLTAAYSVSAQSPVRSTHQAIHHDTSAPLQDLARNSTRSVQSLTAGRQRLENDEEARKAEGEAEQFSEVKENTAFKDVPPVSPSVNRQGMERSSTAALHSSLNTISGLNFDGLTDINFWSVPDTNGAVGDTQYVQWVNVQYAVFDKATGNKILGPLAGATVWSGFGGPCQNNNSGDPIVEFDTAAHRWVLSQHATPSGGPYFECIAVSKTADATGAYYRYAYQLTSLFPDYPKLSVWSDAYYLTLDEEDPANGYAIVDSMACAFDRNAMMHGAAAQAVCFTTSGPIYHSLLPSDLNGSIAPPTGSPNYLLSLGSNALNLWKFHVDFQTTSNSSFAGPTSIPVNAFVKACKGSVCIPQAGTSQLLDSIADRLMWRLMYRHFPDGHESLVTNHTIGASNALVRWYEIQNPGGTPLVVQQGTINPDTNFRWMGSVAMDQVGDIAAGYSESSASMSPAIYINGRQASDPLNTMEGESLVMAGAGSQNGSNRWGDYSAMSVDPVDDCTFWYTSEYLPASGSFNWNTRIASFKFPGCSSDQPPASLAPSILFFTAQPVGTSSATQAISLTNNQSIPLSLSGVKASGDYSQTNNCGSSVAAGGSCNITVTFSPGTGGIRTGNVTVTDDAANSPQVANLTGTGTTPTVSLSSTRLRYGILEIGATSAPQAVTVTNKGQAPLSITAIAAAGTYSESDTCVGNMVLPGNGCTVSSAFSPSVNGTNNAWITLYDNAPGSPHLVALNGVGTFPLTLSPITLAFGTVAVSNSSAPQTVTLTNYHSTSINFTYSASGSYAVASAGTIPCGTSLGAGASCTLQVTFTPTTSGIVNGALSVSYNAANSPQSVGLFGTGSGGSTPPLSFSSTTLLFGPVLQGNTSAAKTVNVTNISGSPLTFSSVAASADFSASGCTGTLGIAKVCKVTVKFSPTVAAGVSGALTFTDDATISPQTIYLNGIGLLPVTFSPSALTFASQSVGTTSSPQIVTVTNNQASLLTISGISASGDYSVSPGGGNPCGGTISALGSCNLAVTFSPAVKGAIGGAVTVVHSAGSSPQTVALTGTGQ